MRKITTGVVVASACLVAANASADDFRHDKAHVVAEFGVGGWAPNYGAKPLASGAIAVVNTRGVAAGPDRIGAADFERRLQLFDDSACLFPPSKPNSGRRWPFSCK